MGEIVTFNQEGKLVGRPNESLGIEGQHYIATHPLVYSQNFLAAAYADSYIFGGQVDSEIATHNFFLPPGRNIVTFNLASEPIKLEDFNISPQVRVEIGQNRRHIISPRKAKVYWAYDPKELVDLLMTDPDRRDSAPTNMSRFADILGKSL